MSGLQTLFDSLSGVNRPQLNMQVQQSQQLNSLRSAQTDEAMNNAQLSVLKAQGERKQQDAQDQMERNMIDYLGPGHEAEARAYVGQIIAMGVKNPNDVVQAFQGLQTLHSKQIIADHNADPAARFAAGESIKGELMPGGVALPNNYQTLPGAPPVVPQQTAEGAAQTDAQNALGALHRTQSDAGGFNPNSGAHPIDPNDMPGMAHAIATGNLAVPSSYAMGRNPSLAHVYNMALTENPALAQSDQPVSQTTEKAFTTGVQGRNVTAINTAVAHTNTARQLIQAVRDSSGDFSNPVVQRVANFIGTQSNQPAPTNLQAAMQLLSGEITKSTIQSGAASEPERTAAQALISATTPDEADSALDTYGTMLAGRSVALKQEYQAGGGKKAFEKTFLTPDSQHALGMTTEVPPPAGSAAAGGGPSGSVSSGAGPAPPLSAKVGPPINAPPPGPAPVVAPPATGVGSNNPLDRNLPPTPVSPPGANDAPALDLGSNRGGGPQPNAGPPPQALAQLQEGRHTTFGNGQTWTLQGGRPTQVQ